MKLVVGLGNPGRRYSRTRHNIGARIVEHFGSRCGIDLSDERFGGRFGSGSPPHAGATPDAPEPERVALLVPETYMNLSGDAVGAALRGLAITDPGEGLLVVFDDVDLPFGRLRVRPGGGSAGHLGLSSVIERLGTSDFPRLRFGVGRPVEPVDASGRPPDPVDRAAGSTARTARRPAERIDTARRPAERVDTARRPAERVDTARRPAERVDTTDWVLQAFSESEEAELETRIPRAADAIQAVLVVGVIPAMNRYNRESPADE